MAIHHSVNAHAAARRLRKEPTMAERVLWRLLRGKRLDGLRFWRQMPIGPYVVDFCCVSRRVVVEADGGVHRLREAEDAARDAWLVAHGFTVLRFSNEVVIGKPNEVFEQIRAEVDRKQRIGTPHPSRSACHLPPQGGKGVKGEIWFYHLERSRLDQVLPELLDRTLKRGWRAIVKVGDERLMDEIDERLWTYRDDSFLAHGRDGEDHAERQPILLSASGENRNGAQALFIVDGVDMGSTEGYARCFIIFDGRDETALHGARERWKTLKGQGADLAYWKQGDDGWHRAA